MLKMTIDNEEVVSKNNFTIKEEMLSPSSTILNNTYPKSWEDDKNYTSRFYYPKDYAKLDIQNFSITPEEAGTTIDIVGSATLTDVDTTKESRVLSLKGQTSQVSYTGKNLLNYTDFSSQANITISGNDITITNTSGATIYPSITFSTPLEAGAYSTKIEIKSITTGKVSTLYVQDDINIYTADHCIVQAMASTTTYVASKTFNDTIKRYMFVVQDGTTIKLNAMLVKGTYTSSNFPSYQPYVGGTASPNPDYPQDVHVVSGDNYINICGKNLLNVDVTFPQTGGGVSFNLRSDGLLTATGTCTATTSIYLTTEQNIVLEPGTYTLNRTTGSTGLSRVYLIPGYKAGTFTLTETTTFNRVYIALTQDDIGRTINTSFYPMLVKDSSVGDYEPYTDTSYPLYLGVENLFDGTYYNAFTSGGSPHTYTEGSTARSGIVEVKGNTTYTISKELSSRFRIGEYSESPVVGSSIATNYIYPNNNDSLTEWTLTTQNTTKYLVIQVSNTSEENIKLQVELGSKANHYTEYGTTPIELCKIGDYQDYIYKEDGSWYLHKEIKKTILTGAEYWLISNNVFYLTNTSDYISSSDKICISDKYTAINNTNAGTSAITQNNSICFFNTNTNPRLYIRDERFNTTDAFKTWLSSNNTIVYYVLANPTTTEITDTTLLEQLDDIESQ